MSEPTFYDALHQTAALCREVAADAEARANALPFGANMMRNRWQGVANGARDIESRISTLSARPNPQEPKR